MLGALQTHTEIGHLHQRAHCLRMSANFLRNKAHTDGNCFPIGTFMDVAAEALSNTAQQSCWTPSQINKALGSTYRSHCLLGRVYSTTCLSTHPHSAPNTQVAKNSVLGDAGYKVFQSSAAALPQQSCGWQQIAPIMQIQAHTWKLPMWLFWRCRNC